MVYGSVMGSFAVEKFGLERLRHLKRARNQRPRAPLRQADPVPL